MTEAFDRGRITSTRHAVATLAARHGLGGVRLEDFVFAVNEIVTNAVRHGGGAGEIRLWLLPVHNGAEPAARLCCEIIDTGPGIPAARVDATPPPATSPNGRGIWLARQMCDVVIETGPRGTVVRLTTTIGAAG